MNHSEEMPDALLESMVSQTFSKHIFTGQGKALPSRELEAAGVEVEIRVGKEFRVEIPVGRDLHKLGFRAWQGYAPLNEGIAAALIRESSFKHTKKLVDPFCGAGTLGLTALSLLKRLPLRPAALSRLQSWLPFAHNQPPS